MLSPFLCIVVPVVPVISPVLGSSVPSAVFGSSVPSPVLGSSVPSPVLASSVLAGPVPSALVPAEPVSILNQDLVFRKVPWILQVVPAPVSVIDSTVANSDLHGESSDHTSIP